jgi:hypothetical protein
MQEDDKKPKVYKISYKDDKGNRDQKIFSASAEQAMDRFEKFKQEYKNYTEIKMNEMPIRGNFKA